MKKKDPAFLFYPKDWISGTSEMLPAEKGIYIDLLCYQHQNTDLPNDTVRLARIVGLGHDEFINLWKSISHKFVPNGERLVNQRLQDVMMERKEKGKTNTISGTFASVLRKAELSKKEYAIIKNEFKIDEFKEIDSGRLSDCITEWLQERLKSIVNGNGNVIVNEDVFMLSISKHKSEKFISVWNEWKKFRSEIKSPLTETSIKKQINFLNTKSETDAIKIIEQSIMNSWQGLFDLKGNVKKSNNATSTGMVY